MFGVLQGTMGGVGSPPSVDGVLGDDEDLHNSQYILKD